MLERWSRMGLPYRVLRVGWAEDALLGLPGMLGMPGMPN